MAISSVKHAIPIAWDMDKGVYVVTPDGAVVLDSPDVPGRQVRVAASVREFERFEPGRCPSETPSDGARHSVAPQIAARMSSDVHRPRARAGLWIVLAARQS